MIRHILNFKKMAVMKQPESLKQVHELLVTLNLHVISMGAVMVG